MFHYGMMHALLIDWSNHRERSGRRLTDALIETVSVLDNGEVPIEDRLQAVELAAEHAADSGIRTAWLTDEVAALNTLVTFGLLTDAQRNRLRHAEREMHKSEEL